MHRLLSLQFHLLTFTLALAALASQAKAVDFNRDVRPILSDKCYVCHGPDAEARQAGLRFDTEEGALDAIVAGDPDDSDLVFRIESDDEDTVMPPPDSHLVLSDKEKATLRRWISQGAKWEGHWAFEPILRPGEPGVGVNPIDAFVISGLDAKAITPAQPSDRATWLRRVTQDLIGLPPSIAEIDAFLIDQSPVACEKVVDRLLASDDYAERMATIWLDNARYADSNGFQFDNQRTMWPWRDWVIQAFQQNMPYDQFVTEQLAGDLLENPTQQQLIATGFNRNHGYSVEGGITDEEYRVTYANDKTSTAGTLFLGLTMDCTRCHDHKYDPLDMDDYYSLYAFFNTSAESGAPGEPGRDQMAAAPFIEHGFSEDNSSKPVLAMVMKEEPRTTYILKQGLFDQPGEEVSPRTPKVLPSFDGYLPNRLGLARWLCSDDNPLFARVTVNRLWQQFFGIGLVKTSDNFGLQGELPSHPQLLDWLAAEFRDSGWDLQTVIRHIVLSATYRQSSNFRTSIDDPENRLLARGPSFRLPAELIRDQALFASGLLTGKIGGPSVMPYQPPGVWEDLNAPPSHVETYTQSDGSDLYRKSLYTYWRRAAPHPAMATFDSPSRNVCTVQRMATNTPLQALVTLHDPTYIEAARAMGEANAGMSQEAGLAIAQGFREILSRQPRDVELRLLEDLYQDRLDFYRHNPDAAERLLSVGHRVVKRGIDKPHVAALTDVYHTVFNLSETLSRK
ncbi:Planctomycete cytochrome C [Rubripirellula obstinata]|uniref:Planctomycete cytochrome C n=2 Tax=Rubripirellula obstinata TaxID=406547 RepID=A0A5B1CCI0_9BACT|nr:Planctomycete cytochrome C [Rubripirellula obstinata]